MGRDNPNCTYRQLDDNFFKRVDNEAKAYLLGWIASDGSIGESGSISIAVHERDGLTLKTLRDIICPDLPVRRKKANQVSLTVNSKTIVADVCRLLDITPGKKSDTVGFPALESDELTWAFVRGYFDGDGCVSSLRSKKTYPRCSITSSSARMRSGIRDFCRIRCAESGDTLQWTGRNALDFLAKLYDGAAYSLSRKRDLYLDWAVWVPALSGAGSHGREMHFRWSMTDPRAEPPFKERASDSGYDVTLIRKVRSMGPFELYGTGIRLEPAYGWYFDLAPRSSIYKTGYMVANSFGVIDGAYRGEILVPLVKIDPSAPDLELPCRIAQLIPRPIIHVEWVLVDELDVTSRGEGGFGSTGGARGDASSERPTA